MGMGWRGGQFIGVEDLSCRDLKPMEKLWRKKCMPKVRNTPTNPKPSIGSLGQCYTGTGIRVSFPGPAFRGKATVAFHQDPLVDGQLHLRYPGQERALVRPPLWEPLRGMGGFSMNMGLTEPSVFDRFHKGSVSYTTKPESFSTWLLYGWDLRCSLGLTKLLDFYYYYSPKRKEKNWDVIRLTRPSNIALCSGRRRKVQQGVGSCREIIYSILIKMFLSDAKHYCILGCLSVAVMSFHSWEQTRVCTELRRNITKHHVSGCLWLLVDTLGPWFFFFPRQSPMSYALLVGTWWHLLGTVYPTDGAGESWLMNTSGSFGSCGFWRLVGGNIGSAHLPGDCEKNCEWKSYQGQAPRTFYVTCMSRYRLGVPRLPSSPPGALSSPATIWALWIERIFKLVDSAESFWALGRLKIRFFDSFSWPLSVPVTGLTISGLSRVTSWICGLFLAIIDVPFQHR